MTRSQKKRWWEYFGFVCNFFSKIQRTLQCQVYQLVAYSLLLKIQFYNLSSTLRLVPPFADFSFLLASPDVEQTSYNQRLHRPRPWWRWCPSGRWAAHASIRLQNGTNVLLPSPAITTGSTDYWSWRYLQPRRCICALSESHAMRGSHGSDVSPLTQNLNNRSAHNWRRCGSARMGVVRCRPNCLELTERWSAWSDS